MLDLELTRSMVVFSNFLVVYFGLNYSSLFCVILVSGRRRIYMYIREQRYIKFCS